MKIYLSLPISGYDFEERKSFARKQELALREIFKGCDVFNPLDNIDGTHRYEYYMGKDLFHLSSCDIIVFCEGFKESRGCAMEYWFARAKHLDMLVITDRGSIVVSDDIYTLKEDDFSFIQIKA